MTGINEWLSSAVGRRMNPDGHYGLQCVDAVDLYAEELFGVPWPRSVGGVAGARQLLDAAPDEYWERIDYHHGFIPQRGDVLVFAGDGLNPWGHTAVVESADKIGISVIQQDGFAPPTKFVDGAYYSDKPAHRARLAYSDRGTGPLSGVLRPRPSKITGGINLQSGTTITPIEEDDMAFTPEEMRGFAKAGFDAWAKEQREFPGGRNLIDHLVQTRTDVGVTAEAVRAIPAAVLYNERVDGRNLFDWAKHGVAVASSIKPGTVNIDELAGALAEQLEARDLEALAAKLQITVKES